VPRSLKAVTSEDQSENLALIPDMLALDENSDAKLIARYEDVYMRMLGQLLYDVKIKVGDGQLEELMCERLALLYVVLRFREARGIGHLNPAADDKDGDAEPGFEDLGEYVSFNKLWFDLATRLQKAMQTAVETNRALSEQKDMLFKGMEDTVRTYIAEEGLTGAEAKTVRESFADKLDKLFHGGGSHRTR
jgi:hypothetical protein